MDSGLKRELEDAEVSTIIKSDLKKIDEFKWGLNTKYNESNMGK